MTIAKRHRYRMSRADRNRIRRGEWNRCFMGRPFTPPWLWGTSHAPDATASLWLVPIGVAP